MDERTGETGNMDEQTGQDVARPRDREAVEGDAPVVPGFTTTGVTGSAGGRAVHGKDKTERVEPVDVDPADKGA